MENNITGSGKRKFKDSFTIFLFLLPALFVYGFYNVYGIVMTFYYSFTDWKGISSVKNLVGFKNYITLFNDAQVWHALKNNLLLVFVSIFVQLVFGLILALIINSKIRFMKFFRLVYFMPMLLSTVSTGILWQLMYDPNFGLINATLNYVGLGHLAKSWLGLESTVMPAVLLAVCWQYTPQYMILLRAGMTNIPEEVYEAAKIDGASSWTQFWKITLPLLSGTLKVSAVLSMVGSLKYFDLFWVMTGGGPNGYSELLATYMYKKGITEMNLGYGSAVAAFMFFTSIIFVSVFFYVTRNKSEEA